MDKSIDNTIANFKKKCKHCGCNYTPSHNSARDLCKKCYHNNSIREKYPLKKRGGPRHGQFSKNYHEPTDEELDMIIAEQLPTMPRK